MTRFSLKNLATQHIPVLYKEVLSALLISPNSDVLDATVGYGGHALEMLGKNAPHGRLIGCDRDSDALEATHKRLKRLTDVKGRYFLFHESFGNLKHLYLEAKKDVPDLSLQSILFDLGVSSPQLDEEARGLSYRGKLGLDMRFDQKSDEKTAWDVIHTAKEDFLYEIFKNYGEIPHAKKVAKAIILARKHHTLDTPEMLIHAVSQAYQKVPFHGVLLVRGKNITAQLFQALRIAVNDEFQQLILALPQALDILQPKGRLALITFHSLEDRIVKHFFQTESKDCLCPSEIPVCRCFHKAKIKIFNKKPILPTEQEIRFNPRARSAKLRVAQKLSDTTTIL